MFNKEDFELPLEKQLSLRVITKDIEECKDVEVLQKNLLAASKSLLQYQHLCVKLMYKTLGLE